MNDMQDAWKNRSTRLFLGLIILCTLIGCYFIIVVQGAWASSLGGAIIGAAASLGATMILEKMELTTHVKAYENRLEDIIQRISCMSPPSIMSNPEQLRSLNLKPGECLYHYSRVNSDNQPIWQEAALCFLATSPSICCCDAYWYAPNGLKVPYRVELGVRGNRIILAITVTTGEREEPTVEIYPRVFCPGENYVAGLAIDDTWSPTIRQLIEPTLLSRVRLVDNERIGGLCSSEQTIVLDKLWIAGFDYHDFMPRK